MVMVKNNYTFGSYLHPYSITLGFYSPSRVFTYVSWLILWNFVTEVAIKSLQKDIYIYICLEISSISISLGSKCGHEQT